MMLTFFSGIFVSWGGMDRFIHIQRYLFKVKIETRSELARATLSILVKFESIKSSH